MSIGTVVHRLVHEAVDARLRIRALIDVLEELSPSSYSKYKEAYRALVERDGAALFAQMALTWEDFSRLCGEWQAADRERYRLYDTTPKKVTPKKRHSKPPPAGAPAKK